MPFGPPPRAGADGRVDGGSPFPASFSLVVVGGDCTFSCHGVGAKQMAHLHIADRPAEACKRPSATLPEASGRPSGDPRTPPGPPGASLWAPRARILGYLAALGLSKWGPWPPFWRPLVSLLPPFGIPWPSFGLPLTSLWPSLGLPKPQTPIFDYLAALGPLMEPKPVAKYC